MASAQVQADTIRTALSSTSSCSSSTVTTLQTLLGSVHKPSKVVPPPSKRVLKSAISTVAPNTAIHRTKTVPKARSKSRIAVTVEILEDGVFHSVLAPKEKLMLATEVVNASLKTLTDALKPQPKSHRRVSSTKNNPLKSSNHAKPSSSPNGARVLTRTPSLTQRPLQPRSVSELCNSPTKPSSLRRSASYSSAQQGPAPCIVATAECARLAFAYLRSAQTEKTGAQIQPVMQLETGMLALVGKLVAHGLESLAVKELRILKQRLEGFMVLENRQKIKHEESVVGRTCPSTLEPETLASLLHFEHINLESPVLPLLVSHQMLVLKIIANARCPAVIEAILEDLELSAGCSPANVILSYAKQASTKAKAAKQLESLVQTLLSLCPSTSSTVDQAASNIKINASPEVTLQIQSLAFQVRRLWWKLAEHHSKDETEIMEPFAKCLAAFIRRSDAPPASKYRTAAQALESLYGSTHSSPQQWTGLPPRFTVYKIIGSLAHAARQTQDAIMWTQSMVDMCAGPAASEAKRAACIIKRTALMLEDGIPTVMSKPQVPGVSDTPESSHQELEAIRTQKRLHGCLSEALDSLGSSLKGDSADLDFLFEEVAGLRRAVVQALSLCAQPGETFDRDLHQQYRAVVFACVHFLTRYLGSSPAKDADEKLVRRHEQRKTLVTRAIKGSVDSIVLCCRASLPENTPPWEAVDTALQDCWHLLLELDRAPHVCRDQGPGQQTDTQLPLVRISNIYWTFHLQQEANPGTSEDTWRLRSIKRSIDIIKDRSWAEKEAGFLAVKFERLGNIYESARRYKDAYQSYLRAVQEYVSGGALRAATELATSKALCAVWHSEGAVGLLGRTLRSLQQLLLRHAPADPGTVTFYDDETLGVEERGIVLEWQLDLYLKTLSKSRHGESAQEPLSTLIERLFVLYSQVEFPLRRLRVAITVLRLTAADDRLISVESVFLAEKCRLAPTSDWAKDSNLQRYRDHLTASLAISISFLQKGPAPIDAIKHSLSTWQSIVDSDSWTSVLDRVDEIEPWISQLQSIADYLGMQGLATMCVATLRLISRVFELQQDQVSHLVTSLSTLGLQYLRLGYSGKAGLILAKAQDAAKLDGVSTEAKLQWHLAYAEYLLGIGSTTKCRESLGAAEFIANNDEELLGLAQSSATMAGRIKFNTLLADASYIHSMLELAVGSTNDALVHARRCVKLNQRIWASIEHRAFAKQRTRGVVPTDTEVDSLTDRIANVTISSASAPTVMSMTHNSLRGAAFWSLVPSLFRGLCHLSHLFSHEGLFQDSTYYAEQAQKVADAVGATPFVVQNLAMTGEYWCRSGDREKMQECVFKGSGLKGRLEPCSTLVMFSRFQAHFHHLQRDWKKEDKAYDEAEAVLQLLSSSAFIYRLNRINSTEDDLIKQMSDPNVEDRSGRKKQTKVTKVKNPTSVVSRGVPRKPTIPVVSATRNKTIEECWGLTEIQADILRRRALTMLRRDKSTAAVELLERAESIQNGHVGAVPQKLAGFRALMTQAMKELQSDITYNVLPESTISFPSLARRKRRPSEPANTRPSFLSPPQKSRIMSPRKSGRDKSSSKEDFVSTLRKARDCISGVQSLAIQTGSTAVVHEICSVLSHTTILMSAATPLSLHPLTAALSMEYPRIHALQRELLAVQHDKRPVHREDLLKRPASTQAPSRLVHMNISQFQEDFIDIIPSSWSAVSLSLNETRDELYVARYHKGQSPFIIRLPMARHKSRDMDEEVFDFDQGKAELQEVIELSNFSTHDARDMSIKGAKSGWWAEREALDGRLHDLLINMENIWLGGFKGILSPHIRQPNLLARFSKSFENILNRNLPSRQNSKNASKRVTLDSRILELFVGLGNDKDGEIDLDESLMDLLYFVVDVLQFNGEGNAYDEVDFDAIVVETLDALRAYHEATTANTDEMPQHTILVLDKRLHAFPWESMPCMDGLSVSRVPSMGALRDRILAQRAQQQQLRQDAAKQNGFNQSMQQDDRFFLDRTSGAYILNPSGDLTATQTVLDPPLSTLPTSWSSTTGRPPTEAEIAASLSSTDIFLYFGHGSGAQYIRSRTIKNMDKCAVALLMGCSSGTVTEYGDFEPTSVPLAYLAAGSMAVAATLWDVTDKDIDRFSVRLGGEWGLWSAQPETKKSRTPKTPGKKGKEGPPKTPVKTSATVRSERSRDRPAGAGRVVGAASLSEGVARSREACYLRYLNGAAPVVYGIPVYLSSEG